MMNIYIWSFLVKFLSEGKCPYFILIYLIVDLTMACKMRQVFVKKSQEFKLKPVMKYGISHPRSTCANYSEKKYDEEKCNPGLFSE